MDQYDPQIYKCILDKGDPRNGEIVDYVMANIDKPKPTRETLKVVVTGRLQTLEQNGRLQKKILTPKNVRYSFKNQKSKELGRSVAYFGEERKRTSHDASTTYFLDQEELNHSEDVDAIASLGSEYRLQSLSCSLRFIILNCLSPHFVEGNIYGLGWLHAIMGMEKMPDDVKQTVTQDLTGPFDPRSRKEAHELLDAGIDLLIREHAHQLLDFYYLKDPRNNEILTKNKKLILDRFDSDLDSVNRLHSVTKRYFPLFRQAMEKTAEDPKSTRR